MGAIALVASACVPAGTRVYRNTENAPTLVTFQAEECTLPSGLRDLKLDEVELRMAQGLRDYSLLVLDAEGGGLEVGDHQLESGNHIFTYRLPNTAWRVVVPDERGADARIEYWRGVGPNNPLNAPPDKTCELKAISVAEPEEMAGTEPNDPAEEGSSSDAPADATCTPGTTQRCVGSGACDGGQSCREDGSGYTPCDCGSNSPTTGPKAEGPRTNEDSDAQELP